jgi:hypothetical protein
MKKFLDIQNIINKNYNYETNGFMTGRIYNDKANSQWSERIIRYTIINKLNTQKTLELFREHYKEVLDNTNTDTHENIISIMKSGIESAKFNDNNYCLKRSDQRIKS